MKDKRLRCFISNQSKSAGIGPIAEHGQFASCF